MLRNNAESYQSEITDQPHVKSTDRSLQIMLWTLWTLTIIGTAFWNWRLDVAAEQPVNMLGIIVYSVLVGLVGMLVITIIELWLEPERFLD
jgi:hypothetical protein